MKLQEERWFPTSTTGKGGAQGGVKTIDNLREPLSLGRPKMLWGNPYRVGPAAASWYAVIFHMSLKLPKASKRLLPH